MFKKITLIIVLAVALAAFLVLRPYIFRKNDPPRLEDRIPDADFLCRAYILDVARETSSMLHYHKVDFRDFFSYEFLLGQSKMYGLNLQQASYLFANEEGDWGALVQVSDSSKIYQGIDRLKKFAFISDTIVSDKKLYKIEQEQIYLYYDRSYMLIYKGKEITKVFNRVVNCKRGDISPGWKAFLKERKFRDEKLVLYSNWEKLKINGVENALFAHDSDSTSFSLKAYARNNKPLNISMKSDGENLISGEFTSKMLNIHLDISKLRKHPEDPIYKWLKKLGNRISFPTEDFLNTWEGDLSFRQGGYQLIKESYIESELDENFNVTEVRKEKEVKVPGFSLLFSVNENGPRFINRLLAKGILTQDENKYRFLFSPPLHLKKIKGYYIFHSGEYTPRRETHGKNNGIWTQRGTKIEFSLDSLSRNEVFGSIYIPVKKLLTKNRFF